jgi:DNA-binding NtrC family response regulator
MLETNHIHRVAPQKANLVSKARSCMINGNCFVQSVFQQINKAALKSANVHIWGETGTGKQAAAAMIHQLSDRLAYALITIDGPAHEIITTQPGSFEDKEFPDAKAEKEIQGLLRRAGEGTLILNDINLIKLDLQEKLLRVIKQAPKTAGASMPGRASIARIVTTSHRNPNIFLRNGTIKTELFEYLSPLQINLKPLRDCKEALPALANHYFRYYGNNPKKKVLPESVMQQLLNYDWPGNLYELQNTIQRYLVYDEIIFLAAKAESDKVNRLANSDHHHPVKSETKATCKLSRCELSYACSHEKQI